jgi:hypothetical protein
LVASLSRLRHRVAPEVGRLYPTRGGPDSLRWFWSLTINGPMTRADKVATLEEAKAQFQKELGRLEGLGEAGGGAGRIMINFWDDNSHA